MSDDLISREEAYMVLTDYYHHTTDVQHKALRDALSRVPSAQADVPDTNVGDLISRQAAIDAIECVPWYHQNRNKDMVSGANSDEHQPWYKSQDIYKAILELQSAQPEPYEELDFVQEHKKIPVVLDIQQKGKSMPSAQPEQRWIPCSERLPNARTEVIVSCIDDSGDTSFAYTGSGWLTTDKEYWIVDNEICSFVVAWCEMPEPYREEGGE